MTSITWVNFETNFEECKEKTKSFCGHGTTKIPSSPSELTFYAHYKDKIRGKPELLEISRKSIVLVRSETIPDKKDEDSHRSNITCFDEAYDKRYAKGVTTAVLTEDFWLYKLMSEEKKLYYLWSQKELPLSKCVLQGMEVCVTDDAEMSRSLKLKSLSNIFIVYEAIPDVKLLSKQELIKLTKDKQINEFDWFNHIEQHPNGNFNRFVPEVRFLRSSFLLHGKESDWPSHLMVFGITGTKKTMGHEETLANRFDELTPILEASNSTLKGLNVSHKETHADPGFISKCNRIAIIDEIGKLIEAELNRHQSKRYNIGGELNPLLEHKDRTVASGNSGNTRIKPTAKVLCVTNPLSNKCNIYEHVGVIDPTFLSRFLVWVQDNEEVEFAHSENSVEIASFDNFPPTPTQDYTTLCEGERKSTLEKVLGEKVIVKVSKEDFLTIFDSCYAFLSKIDHERIKSLVEHTLSIANPNAKDYVRSVWRPRAIHHVTLLVDGICKHRCLFRDYDPTFEAKGVDYELAKLILTRMVKAWDTMFGVEQ